MRRLTTYYEKIIAISSLNLIIPPLVEFLRFTVFPSFMTILLSVFTATSELLVLPIPDEDPKTAFFCSLSIAVIFILFRGLRLEPCVLLFVVSLIILLHYYREARNRFSKIRPIFKQQGLLYLMNCHSRYLFSLSLTCLGIGVLIAKNILWAQISLLCLMLVLYILLAVSARSGRLFIMSENGEKEFRKMLYSMVIDNPSPAPVCKSMQTIYNQMVEYLTISKAFLDKNYSLNELACSIYTNKTYASKTINVITRNNFNSFINNFRVDYSIELMRNKPDLRINEIAYMSGFNNRNTFTYAFQQKTGIHPGEYKQRLRYDKDFNESLSKMRVPELKDV